VLSNMVDIRYNKFMQNLDEALQTLGLSQNEGNVYKVLLTSGWITVLALSRKCLHKRSTLYRLLESLCQKGLAETRVDEKTTYYAVAGSDSLKEKVSEEIRRVNKFQEAAALVQLQYNSILATEPQRTEVRFHRGVKSIQMVEWKTAQAEDSETLVFATNQWTNFAGRELSEQIREERLNRNATIKELANEKNYGKIPKNGKVGWTTNKDYLLKIYRHRLIPSSVLPITNETLIQANSVYFYGLENNEIVVLEFISTSYANLVKGLFNMAWKDAKALDDFGS